MASRVDGLSSLFTAIEPPSASSSAATANQSAARSDSRGFADHLQQASQSKNATAEPRDNSTPPPARNEPKKSHSHGKSTRSERSARDAKSDVNPSTKPTADDSVTDSDATNETTSATDDSSTDVTATADAQTDAKDESEAKTADDAVAAALQVAQVVVPEVIVAPQAELAVHTEVATAGDTDQVVPSSAVPTPTDAKNTAEPTPQAKTTTDPQLTEVVATATAEQVATVAKVQASPQVVDPQTAKSNEPATVAPNPKVSEVAPQVIDVASQVQVVEAKVAPDRDGERDQNSEQTTSTDAALKNDVTQVVASPAVAAAAATSTTVVSAISSVENGGNEKKSKDDQERSTSDVGAIDTSVGQDRAVTNDGGIPRHARLALEKLTAHSGKTEETPTLTEAERVRFVQRVANAIHNAAETGGPIRLRLSPPELGAVRIEMRVVEGQMSVRMEAETTQAQSALLDNLPVLRERLEAQDIKIAKFDVDLFGGSNSNLSQSPQRDPTQDTPLPRHQLRRDVATSDVPEPNSAVSRPNLSSDGRLNVLI